MEKLHILMIQPDRGDSPGASTQPNREESSSFVIDTVGSFDAADMTLRDVYFDAIVANVWSAESSAAAVTLAGKHAQVPMVILGPDDEAELTKALSHGVQDWLIATEVDAEVLKRAIQRATARQRRVDTLLWTSTRDEETGLLNRTAVEARLGEAMGRCGRTEQPLGTIALGIASAPLGSHPGSVGQHVADHLLGAVREVDHLARIGPDVFILVAENVSSREAAAALAERLFRTVAASPLPDGSVSLCAGISLWNGRRDVVGEVKEALTALDAARHSGSNRWAFSTPEETEQVTHIRRRARELSLALERDEFEIQLQPVVDISSGRIVAGEAFLRWRRSDEHQAVRPREFLSTLESSGQIREVGAWVLTEAVRTLAGLGGVTAGIDRVSVNVSIEQLLDNVPFVDRVNQALRDNGLPPTCLEIEVREADVLTEEPHARDTLRALSQAGVRITLDDFGTRRSSYAAVKELPIQGVKVDQAFVKDVDSDEDSGAIVSSIVHFGRSRGLTVVAEAVETRNQHEKLRELGCHLGQGNYFSEPLDPMRFVTWLERRARPSAVVVGN